MKIETKIRTVITTLERLYTPKSNGGSNTDIDRANYIKPF